MDLPHIVVLEYEDGTPVPMHKRWVMAHARHLMLQAQHRSMDYSTHKRRNAPTDPKSAAYRRYGSKNLSDMTTKAQEESRTCTAIMRPFELGVVMSEATRDLLIRFGWGAVRGSVLQARASARSLRVLQEVMGAHKAARAPAGAAAAAEAAAVAATAACSPAGAG